MPPKQKPSIYVFGVGTIIVLVLVFLVLFLLAVVGIGLGIYAIVGKNLGPVGPIGPQGVCNQTECDEVSNALNETLIACNIDGESCGPVNTTEMQENITVIENYLDQCNITSSTGGCGPAEYAFYDIQVNGTGPFTSGYQTYQLHFTRIGRTVELQVDGVVSNCNTSAPITIPLTGISDYWLSSVNAGSDPEMLAPVIVRNGGSFVVGSMDLFLTAPSIIIYSDPDGGSFSTGFCGLPSNIVMNYLADW